MRHRARPLLAGGEIFLGLEHLGPLQVADLGRQPLDAAGDNAEDREIHRVAVTRDDLRADRLDRQSHLVGDPRLDERVDVGEGADRARDGAGRDLGACRDEPGTAAVELGIGLRQFQPEGRRLGVDAVAAADRRRIPEFEGSAAQHGEQRVDIGDHQVGGARQLDAEAGVEDVGTRHPLVDEARRLADMFGKVGQEGDDVVLGLALDFVDAVDLEAALGPHRRRRLARDDAEFGERVHRVRFDLEPDAEAGFGLPDGDHRGTRIAGNHRRVLTGAARAAAATD